MKKTCLKVDPTQCRNASELTSWDYLDKAETTQNFKGPAVVVFSEAGKPSAVSASSSKAQLRAFMVGTSQDHASVLRWKN